MFHHVEIKNKKCNIIGYWLWQIGYLHLKKGCLCREAMAESNCCHPSDSAVVAAFMIVFIFPTFLPSSLAQCLGEKGRGTLLTSNRGWGGVVSSLFPFLGCNALFLSGHIVWRPTGVYLMHGANVSSCHTIDERRPGRGAQQTDGCFMSYYTADS